ncbi:hypothetical protein EQ718_09490 [Paracoccus versutus]|uniref:Uncharacterized protein n=1 Tax=Paracoccus versutus TaxID=34007 RepID=A0AAQ0HEA7_PARVE|nr:hypothetical protein [Paracoccus versutus]REG34880.1 hypothetical protein ATH84_10382 [Paracoccus versutus]WEJ79094.1 hypothetical protein EQ718_09490 [Paracoccus versutus]SFY41021.1 hypothetical protein SAMN04244548_04269 [Paracoccus pantotrophus]
MHQHFMQAGDFPKQVLGNFALTVHIRPRPPDALDRGLEDYPSDVRNHGHLLLEQRCDRDDGLIADLVGYLESASADARLLP